MTNITTSLEAQFDCLSDSLERGRSSHLENARKIYNSLHCRIAPSTHFFGDLGRSGPYYWNKAYKELSGFSYPRTGWSRQNKNDPFVRDGRGIEVEPPHDAIVTDGIDGITFMAPSLLLSNFHRWLQWNSLAALPEKGYRIYVSARSEFAFDAWISAVKEVARAGIPCSMKVAASVQLAQRADCIVAYCASTNASEVIAAISRTADVAWLRSDAPGFAVPVDKGISVGLSDGSLEFTTSLGWDWSMRISRAYSDFGSDEVRLIFTQLRDLRDTMLAHAEHAVARR